jgi:hypothetical protein
MLMLCVGLHCVKHCEYGPYWTLFDVSPFEQVREKRRPRQLKRNRGFGDLLRQRPRVWKKQKKRYIEYFCQVVLFVASMCDILKPCTFFLLFLSKFKKAIECYTKSAEMGYSHAMYCLGKCFKSGWGMVSFLFCGLRFAGGISCSPSQLSKSTGTDFFSFVTLLI